MAAAWEDPCFDTESLVSSTASAPQSPSVSPPASWLAVRRRSRRHWGKRAKAPATAKATGTQGPAAGSGKSAGCGLAAAAPQPKRRRLHTKTKDDGIPPPVRRRPSDCQAERLRLQGHHYRRMKRLGLPALFFRILDAVLVPDAPLLKCVEYFSGVETIVSAFRENGMPAEPFDIRNSWRQDLCNVTGFVTALRLASRLQDGASLATFATVCSTWVWVSRSSTGRSSNNPHGNTTLGCVRTANLMVARTALLALYLLCRNVRWLLEQPSSSLMSQHSRLRMLQRLGGAGARPFEAAQWGDIFTWLGAFGGEISKPTRLYGNGGVRFLAALRRDRPPLGTFQAQAAGVYRVDVTGGKKSVSGGPRLKATQEYPKEFGRQVCLAFLAAPALVTDDEDGESNADGSEDSWGSADLKVVAEDLGMGMC